jgi:hypothetical protein
LFNIFIGKDASVAILRQDDVVGFEVHEGKITGDWYGPVPGAVRPELKWINEPIDCDDPGSTNAKKSTSAPGFGVILQS